MYIQYGTVVLNFIDSNEVKKEQVLTSDDTDYVYTKWTIDVNCLYAPASHTANYSGDFATGGGVPKKEPGNTNPFGVGQASTGGALPNLTDRSIRHYLFQPRRQLTIWSDFDGDSPFLILQSPWIPGDAPTPPNVKSACPTGDVSLPDELNGPFVEACDVVECKGVRSWWVRIRIVTYVNECGGQFSQNSPNPISAHRWKRWVDTDEDYYATLITEGEVVFRPAVLINAKTWPDQYRANFFPPIDPTFRRDKIEVIPSSDGTKINYRVVDRELAFSIGAPFNGAGGCPATRIECFQTTGYSRAGIRESLIKAGNLKFGSAAAAMCPMVMDHIVVKAWGNRLARRLTLLQLAFGISFQRMGNLAQGIDGIGNPGFPINGFEILATQEITGQYVELVMTYRSGPEQAVNLLPSPATIVGTIGSRFSIDNTIQWRGVVVNYNDPILGATSITGPPTTISNVPASPPPGPRFQYPYAYGNPPPPYSNGGRGTWRGKLVAQALAYPCGCAMPLGPTSPVTAPFVQGQSLAINKNQTNSVVVYDSNGVPVVPTDPNPDL
jgi:hypothetical protein